MNAPVVSEEVHLTIRDAFSKIHEEIREEGGEFDFRFHLCRLKRFQQIIDADVTTSDGHFHD